MSEYQQLIRRAVKDQIDARIGKLKSTYLNLADDWRIIFPAGFRPGINTLPVVADNGSEKRQIAMLEFELADDLDLDIDKIKVVEVDTIYESLHQQPDLGDSLDMLNDIMISLNEFIGGLTFNVPKGQMQMFPSMLPASDRKVHMNVGASDDLRIRREIEQSLYLPDWFRNIKDAKVREELLGKLADAYQQFEKSSPEPVTLKLFFEKYTEHLKNQGHLHYWCSYKGKPVKLTDAGLCTERYCSKKPYSGRCDVPVLKFGKED